MDEAIKHVHVYVYKQLRLHSLPGSGYILLTQGTSRSLVESHELLCCCAGSSVVCAQWLPRCCTAEENRGRGRALLVCLSVDLKWRILGMRATTGSFSAVRKEEEPPSSFSRGLGRTGKRTKKLVPCPSRRSWESFLNLSRLSSLASRRTLSQRPAQLAPWASAIPPDPTGGTYSGAARASNMAAVPRVREGQSRSAVLIVIWQGTWLRNGRWWSSRLWVSSTWATYLRTTGSAGSSAISSLFTAKATISWRFIPHQKWAQSFAQYLVNEVKLLAWSNLFLLPLLVLELIYCYTSEGKLILKDLAWCVNNPCIILPSLWSTWESCDSQVGANS